MKKILLFFILSMNAVSVSASNNIALATVTLALATLIADEAVYFKKNYDIKILPSHETLQIIPSNEERLELLETFFSNKEQYLDINIALIHRLTNHYSYAKLAKMLNEARNLAEGDNLTMMTMKHVNNAIYNIELGYKQKEKLFSFLGQTTMDYKSTAIHEAGHIVASIYKKSHIIMHYATIENRILFDGLCRSINISNINPLSINGTLITTLCGGVAEQIFDLLPLYPQKMLTHKNDILNFLNQHQGMSTDMKSARNLIHNHRPRLSDQEINNELVKVYRVAYQFLTAHKEEVDKVANLLIEKGSIEGSDIYDLLNIDKPLYDFESGPLPKNLENYYQYRGDYEKHQKEINDLDYKKYVASIFKQSQTSGNLFVNPLPQDLYEKLGNDLENSRVQQTFAENNGESAIIEID